MKAKKILALTLVTLTLCSTLAACGNKPTSENDQEIMIGRLNQNVMEIAALSHMDEHYVTSELRKYKDFPTMNAMLLELKSGRVDALVAPSSVANYLASKVDKLLTIEEARDDHFHMAARAEDTALTEELSSAIDALKADGTMDKLIADYITNATGDPTANALASNPDGETHVVAVTGDLPPLDFVASDATPAGFNVALLNAIAEKNGCNFEIIQMDAAARLSALESGKIDLIFWIDCQGDVDFEPEMDGVSLTSPYFGGTTTFVSYSADIIEKLKATMPTPKE